MPIIHNTGVTIKKSALIRIHKALIDAKFNAQELLDEYKLPYNDYLKKDRAIINMYENEINELNQLLEYTENKGGIPF